MVSSEAHLFADGAFYLQVILTTGEPQDLQPKRYFANVVTQMPVALAIQAGMSDLRTLSLLLGACLHLPVVVSLACCAWIARHAQTYLLFPLLSAVAVTANSTFFISSESHFLLALFWPLLFLLTLHRHWSGSAFAAAGGLAAATLLSYESMVVYGPLLAALSLRRAQTADDLARRCGFLTLAAYFVAGAVAGAYWIIWPVSPENLESFKQSAWPFDDGLGHTHVLGVLSLVALCLVSWAMLHRRFRAGPWRLAIPLFAAACAWAALAPLIAPTLIAPFLHYRARVMNVFLPPLVATLYLFAVARPPEQATWRAAFTVVAILASAQAVWHVAAVREWRHYLDVFRSEVAIGRGLIPYEESRLSHPSEGGHPIAGLNWGWTMPTMSILLAPDGDVRAIVRNPTSNAWQPFDPGVPFELPDLRRYGVRFDTYRAHLGR
jgi:hypothetical protein